MSTQPIRITHINTIDGVGGAARGAYRLHQGLRMAGHDSRMLTGYKTIDEPEIAGVLSASFTKRALNRVINELENWTGMQYLFPRQLDFLTHNFVRSAQLINLHNLIGGYFSPMLLPVLSRERPLIWTLHDQWAFTGHCGYSFDCKNWFTGCGKCPYLDGYPSLMRDTTAILWRVKDWIYKQCDITVVTESAWLANLARTSPLLGRFSVRQIRLGLDLTLWRPLDQQESRDALGLPQDKRLLLFGASDLAQARKGASHFVDATKYLSEDGLGVVVFGTNAKTLTIPNRIPLFDLGLLNDDRALARAYSAVDMYVSPTLGEIFGATVLESICCGTPVVAYASDAIPELVRHMETGYLARRADPRDLARGIRTLLDDAGLRHRIAARARQIAEDEYSVAGMVSQYIELYRAILERKRK